MVIYKSYVDYNNIIIDNNTNIYIILQYFFDYNLMINMYTNLYKILNNHLSFINILYQSNNGILFTFIVL